MRVGPGARARGHAAEPPSSCFATPPLRFGRFAVTTPLAPLARMAALFWDYDAKEVAARVAEPPPVPITAIVSLSDGILDWRACVPRPSAQTEVVALTGDHMTMGSNPDVLRVIAARLGGRQNSAG